MAADIERAAFEKFGKWLVENVRDYAIRDSDRMLEEPPETAAYSRWLYERLSSELNDEQRKLVLYLIPQIVDAALHHLLWSLGETDWIDVGVRVDSREAHILSGTGEVMKGRLFEWIRDFSKQRFDYLDDADSFLPEI